MRKIMPLIVTLFVLGMAWMLISKMSGKKEDSMWYVVAARNIPAYTAIDRDQVTLRQLPQGTKPPPTAIVEADGPLGHNAIDLVLGKASPKAIKTNALITSENIRPFEELENERGAFVLIAKNTILPHSSITPSQFNTIFKESKNIKHGVVIGRVGQTPEKILEQFINPYSSKIIHSGETLEMKDISLEETKQSNTSGLDLNKPLPQMDRDELIQHLNETSGAIPLGLKDPEEIKHIQGNIGPVDIYMSASPQNGGIITYRKVLVNRAIGMTSNTTKQIKDVIATSQEQAQQDLQSPVVVENSNAPKGTAPEPTHRVIVPDVMKTVQDTNPVFWIRDNATIANEVNALRIGGASLIAVPAHKTMADLSDGPAVLCTQDGNTCYQTENTKTTQEMAEQYIAQAQQRAAQRTGRQGQNTNQRQRNMPADRIGQINQPTP